LRSSRYRSPAAAVWKAEAIRRDQIEILVDLTGRTGNHRLELFATRPAPVQATWLGYFDGTGLPTIDYLIADRYLCPEGSDHLYVEEVIRLPGTYTCYAPREEMEIKPPLSLESGYVTFGCFNKLAKLNDRWPPRGRGC
jgi:predicted O-linked N-acetylglucosamine transferase (SPINDLY family)